MIAYLICLLWSHKTVHRTMAGKYSESTGAIDSAAIRFTRTPFCTRCGKLCHGENTPGDWTFETDEQIAAFMAFFIRIKQEDNEDIGIALRNPRSPLQVVASNYVARRLAQAFQFGWMIGQDLQKGKQGEAPRIRHKI